MKNKFLKTILWTLLTIIGIVFVGYGGCVGCVLVIAESNNCERYNIDNIELRTGIDIPTICRDQECRSCILDKTANTKTNYFRILTDVEDMDRYVARNSFIPVNEVDLDLSVFAELVKIPEITSDNKQNFYYNSGIIKRTRRLAVLDKNSGDLWIYIKYKD